MVNVQRYFNKFDDTIRRSYDDNSILREKRDLLLEEVRADLRSYFGNYNVKIPKYESFNQGSYTMGTGVEPLPGEDYDIDVGLLFHISKNDYSPIEVKKWVYEALQSGNRTVEYKRPCVRVQYHKAGKEAYHVDFAVYSTGPWNNQTYLAKGFPGSKPENQDWEVAEPRRLIEIFRQKFPNQDHQDQFRRVIRFLKRWKDVTFSPDGNKRPTGIAMTACAMNWFQVKTAYNDSDGKYYYDDFTAFKKLAESILNQFDFRPRMSVQLPVSPHNDLFEKMSDQQMQNFKVKLAGLVTIKRDKVEKAPDALRACCALQSVFGNDFPLP